MALLALTSSTNQTGPPCRSRNPRYCRNRAIQFVASHKLHSQSHPERLTMFYLFSIAAMRELYMKSGQGFLLVFSITSLSSLRELNDLREQLIRIQDDPKVPIVLVGNKSDLEENRNVSRSRAHHVSQSWGGKPYYETSARNRTNVDEVFIDLCRQIIRKELVAETSGGSNSERRRHHHGHHSSRREHGHSSRSHAGGSRRTGRGSSKKSSKSNNCAIL